MKPFLKDVMPHHITEAERNKTIGKQAADAIIAEVEKALDVPATTVPIDENVRRFTEKIGENFERTATNLDIVATRLENAAKDLRKRATELRSASPNVREHIENWTTFERQSSERSKFLNTLFQDKLNNT